MFAFSKTVHLAETVLLNLLTIALYCFATAFILGLGSHLTFLYIATAILGSLLLFPGIRRYLDIRNTAVIVVILLLYVQSHLTSGAEMATGFHRHVLWALVPFVGIAILPDKLLLPEYIRHRSLIAGMGCLFVVVQWLGYYYKANEAGFISNIHYLALFAVLTLPILVYSIFASRHKGLQFLYFMAASGDLLLLLKTQSRPGFLALLAATGVTVPFLSPRFKFPAVIGLTVGPVALYFIDIFRFRQRVDDLVLHFAQEERHVIWSETLTMQLNDNLMGWLFGHGIGSYYRDFQQYSSFHDKTQIFSFPHNFVLDILYSHGLVGVLLSGAAFIWFLYALSKSVLTARSIEHHRLGVLLISLTTGHFFHTFLTVPLFSRYNLYPLVIILGIGLHYLRRA